MILVNMEVHRGVNGLVAAWASCHRGRPFLADVARSIDSALAKVDSARTSDWSVRVERVTAELRVPAFAGVCGASPHPPGGPAGRGGERARRPSVRWGRTRCGTADAPSGRRAAHCD